jgi:hypothetical protein
MPRLSFVSAGAGLLDTHDGGKVAAWELGEDYNYGASTEDNYGGPAADTASGDDGQEDADNNHSSRFVGKYALERAALDYSYHKYYNSDRQLLQDTMIDLFHDTVIHDTENNTTCDVPLENWMVFTAGCMGAGKGHTIHWLASQGLFPLNAFVRVDPDTLRELLPELSGYINADPATAGYMTQKEAGYIAEVLSLEALRKGKNVLVDGSLRQADWYKEYITGLHEQFPKMRFAIIHVTAKESTVYERVEKRTKETGRVVPKELLQDTLRQIPLSLRILAPYVDYMATFANEDDTEEPVLLWSSKRPSPSSTDLYSSSLPVFGDEPEKRETNTIFDTKFTSKEHSGYIIGEGEDAEDGDEEEEVVTRDRTYSEQHRVIYNVEGEGLELSESVTSPKIEENEHFSPNDEWKSSFKSTWKMHCPLPLRKPKS